MNDPTDLINDEVIIIIIAKQELNSCSHAKSQLQVCVVHSETISVRQT